jgi:hypothetical protein
MTTKEKAKQTAIEWLIDEITFSERNLYNWMWIKLKTTIQGYNLTKIIEQAKEMEKQMIIDSFEDGNEQGFICKTGEEYYNETYKK